MPENCWHTWQVTQMKRPRRATLSDSSERRPPPSPPARGKAPRRFGEGPASSEAGPPLSPPPPAIGPAAICMRSSSCRPPQRGAVTNSPPSRRAARPVSVSAKPPAPPRATRAARRAARRGSPVDGVRDSEVEHQERLGRARGEGRLSSAGLGKVRGKLNLWRRAARAKDRLCPDRLRRNSRSVRMNGSACARVASARIASASERPASQRGLSSKKEWSTCSRLCA